jgi:hypothetical protein
VKRYVAAAYVLDRAEQYEADSGIYEALNQVAWALASGEHELASRHGELDDLVNLVKENEACRAAKEGA